MADTFTFLGLDKYGLRKLEAFFCLLIAIMMGSFGYEYAVSGPDPGEIIKGLVIPGCSDCGRPQLLQVHTLLSRTLRNMIMTYYILTCRLWG